MNVKSYHLKKGTILGITLSSINLSSVSELDIAKGNELKNETLSKVEESLKKANDDPDPNLIRVLDDAIDEVFNQCKKEVSNGWYFNTDYTLDFVIYVYVQGKKIILKMLEKQFNNNSLVQHLESERNKLLENFRCDCLAIDADARTGTLIFQDILLKVIEIKTNQGLGVKVFDDLMRSDTFMHKKDMMFHLHEELLSASWKKVYDFCNSYKQYVEEWVHQKIDNYCLKNEYLSKQTKERTKTAIESVIETTTALLSDSIEKEYTTSAWFQLLIHAMDCYSGDLDESIAELNSRITNIQDLDTVSTKMIQMLNEYKIEFSKKTFGQIFGDRIELLKSLPFNPIQNLMNQRVGCTEQCPFCGSVCLNSLDCNGTNLKHKVDLHRSQGFAGTVYQDTNVLVTDICSTLVCTDATYLISANTEFKSFKNVAIDIPDWAFHGMEGEAEEFWQYLFSLHHEQIAAKVGRKPAKIPSGWNTVTKNMATTNLKHIFKVIK